MEPSGTRHGGKIGGNPFRVSSLMIWLFFLSAARAFWTDWREISLFDRFTAVAARSALRRARQTFALRARHCELNGPYLVSLSPSSAATSCASSSARNP